MSVSRDFSEEFNIWDVPIKLSGHDKQILRDLAKRVAEIAAMPQQMEKISCS